MKSKIKCRRCDHEWETSSQLKLITCPSCNLKTPNHNYTNKEDEKRII